MSHLSATLNKQNNKICAHLWYYITVILRIAFFHLVLVPQEWDLPTTGGIHYGFAWICFPFLGLELKFFGVDGGVLHSPVSTGSGHFCTPLSAGWAPAVIIVLWYHCLLTVKRD